MTGISSRAWTRAVASFTCGRCADVLLPGSPLLQIFLAGVKRVKKRCEKCADEPVPVDLPEKVERELLQLTAFDEDGIERPIPHSKPMTPIRQLAGLPLDWKRKASGA